MTYALIWLSGGIIANVTFIESELQAIKTLADFVKGMDVHDDDAAVFGPQGLVANAKDFLDDDNKPIEGPEILNEVISSNEEPKSIYLIGNPEHRLGFMVASPDDPLGIEDAAEAVSELAQMRSDAGNHLKLYRVVPVEEPIVARADLERYNVENEIEDFVFPLVEEYVNN